MSVVLRPGGPSVCPGEVFHGRRSPAVNEFSSPASYVWLDPDDPAALCRHHPLWSATRMSPARFRRRDYGDARTGSLGERVRDELAPLLGRRPAGEVRMLTQVRRWGWLFNPITVYLVWDADPQLPVGAVLEVTNTPWKERHRYPLVWEVDGDRLTARVRKILHVSPFLDEDHEYVVGLRPADETALTFSIDVVPVGRTEPILVTGLRVDRLPATRAVLGRTLVTRAASTYRVSVGIHAQALRLWLKRVPFIPHPSKRRSVT